MDSGIKFEVTSQTLRNCLNRIEELGGKSETKPGLCHRKMMLGPECWRGAR